MLASAKPLARLIVKMAGNDRADPPGLRKNKHLGGPFVLYDADNEDAAKGAAKKINHDKKNGKSECARWCLQFAFSVPSLHMY